MVWLAIDLGEARIGLALSNSEHTFAYPAGIIEAHGHPERCFEDIIDIVEKNKVEKIIIGLPLQLNGAQGQSAHKIRRWENALERMISMYFLQGDIAIAECPTIELYDERLTSEQAHKALSEAGLSIRSHKPYTDQQAAVVILNNALDRFNSQQ